MLSTVQWRSASAAGRMSSLMRLGSGSCGSATRASYTRCESLSGSRGKRFSRDRVQASQSLRPKGTHAVANLPRMQFVWKMSLVIASMGLACTGTPALPDTTLPDDDDSWKRQPKQKKPGTGRAFRDGVVTTSEPLAARAAWSSHKTRAWVVADSCWPPRASSTELPISAASAVCPGPSRPGKSSRACRTPSADCMTRREERVCRAQMTDEQQSHAVRGRCCMCASFSPAC
jgi:hypothetical protein